MTRGGRVRRSQSLASDRGVVAVLVAALITALLVVTALALDTGRWYIEASRVQAAADAAAMAGVTYMPNEYAKADTAAKGIAANNGYSTGASTSVTTFTTGRKSELGVTVSSTIRNTFGSMFGNPTTTIARTAIADYMGAAILGSPCNYFGNQPPSTPQAARATNASPLAGNHAIPGSGAVLGTVIPTTGQGGHATCQDSPELWAVIQGAGQDKSNGDRYATTQCDGGDTDCDIPNQSSLSTNAEYDPDGYYYVVRVTPDAVGRDISLQLYDPAYVLTESTCEYLPSYDADGTNNGVNGVYNNMNAWAPDADLRYSDQATGSRANSLYCPGDRLDSSGGSMTTSYALLAPDPSEDPDQAVPVSASCTRQFTGWNDGDSGSSWWLDRLVASRGTYDNALASVFHQWVELCTFRPTAPGDYYLQVRSNVTTQANWWNAAPNESETGVNAFAIRAVVDPITSASAVAISGWERMPLRVNASSATPEFNLIQVFTNAAGKRFEFSFFDVGDGLGSGTGTVQIVYPKGAKLGATTIADPTPPAACDYVFPGVASNTPQTASNCQVTIRSSTNNGRVERMSVRIPSDYVCDYVNLGSCWFRVKMNYGSATPTDTTTWDAFIVGDAVRLVE